MGLSADDVAGVPAHMAGCGLPFTYLAVRPGAVDRAVPDHGGARRARAWGRASRCSPGTPPPSTAYARVFAGDLHWDEDPATGSAALGTGVWLVATGLLAGDGTSSYVVRQGEKLGRPVGADLHRDRVRRPGVVRDRAGRRRADRERPHPGAR